MSKSNNAAVELLDQIIEKAKEDDRQHKIRALNAHKGQQAVGEGWMVYHLKKLKELIQTKNA